MKIVIYLYPGLTLLDAIGPYEVLRNLEGAEILFAARKRGRIIADSHLNQLQAKYRIADIKEADVLLIPGSTISFIKEAHNQKVLEWIKAVAETTQYTTSVGTGSIILAATGLLQEKQATSHWKTVPLLADHGAVPVKERVVQQGKFITAAGVSAGIDLGLHLVHALKGEEAARAAQLAIEYDPAPLFDSGNIDRCSPEVIALADQLRDQVANQDFSWWDKLKNARSLRKLRKLTAARDN